MTDPHAPGPWSAGYDDGWRVGPDGIDPDGNPVPPGAGYNADLMGEDEYRQGLSDGRSDRIDQNLVDRMHSGEIPAWRHPEGGVRR